MDIHDKNIAILYGGWSDERDISLDSGKSVYKAVDFINGEISDKIINNQSFNQEALDKSRNRNRFHFALVGIEPGEILEFKKDKTIIAKVLEDDKIEFRGRSMSLSPAALIVIKELGYEWSKIAGPQFWCYKGKTLYEISSLK